MFSAKLQSITKKVIYFAFISIVLVNGLFALPRWITTLKYPLHFFMFQEGVDSWGGMNDAIEYFGKEYPKNGLIYSYIFFNQETKFQYPPTSLLPLYAFSKIFINPTMIVRCISWVCIWAMIFLVVRIFHWPQNKRPKVKEGDLYKIKSPDGLIITGLIIMLCFLYYPVMKSYELGQIQTWLNTMFASLFYCWLRNWHARGGILLGLMCLIKPQYSLILLWGMARKKWRFVMCALSVILTGLSVSVLIFGIENHLEYLSVLEYISLRGEAYYPNNTMNGLLNRLLLNGDALDFHCCRDGFAFFPPFHPIVYGGTMLFAGILIILAYLLPRMARMEGTIFDLGTIGIVSTITSPIAWEHHYGILLPIYAFIFSYLLSSGEYEGKKVYPYLWAIGFSYLLSSNFIPAFNVFGYKLYLNIFLSYLFFGVVILLTCLFLLLFGIGNSRYPKMKRAQFSQILIKR